MSLYKDASLVMIPSAYKDGKLYSIRPTDGSGDFTFSRGSNLAATRVDVNGLIEKGRENVIVYSQDFSNANWSTNASATISHGITDPNGGSTASRITFTANVNSGIYQQNPTLFASGNVRTASLYMKGAVGGEVVMFGDATNRTSVTLTTSWVRYEGFGIDASTYFIIYTNTSSPSADTIDIAFVQYENGLVATDYIETGTSAAQSGILEDMPRLDYSGSCPSLLLEPQRTNVLSNSEYGFSNTNSTITYNATTSPEGVQNAFKLTENSGAGSHRADTNFSADAATYTFSVFAKAGERNYINFAGSNVGAFSSTFNLSTGVLEGITGGTGDIEDYGNGWYRLIVTKTISSAGGVAVRIGTATSSATQSTGNTQNYTGDGVSGLYLYGYMVEQGSYPTSYIPTYGTSQTRSYDNPFLANVSSLIGQTQGSVLVELTRDALESYTQRVVTLSDGTSNNTIGLQLTAANSFSYYVTKDGVLQGLVTKNDATTANQKVKVAFAYAENDFVMYVDGVLAGTDTSGSIPAANTIKFQRESNGLHYVGLINQLSVFPTRLTNAELAALTTI